MRRICFVCLGNICRSPLAEGIFKHLAARAGRDKDFHIESAGVEGWHVGDAPDLRAQRVALAHGFRLESHAQQFRRVDFARVDQVLALDQEVAESLRALASGAADRAKIQLLREYDPLASNDLDVPDPYYGGTDAFELAYTLIERSCGALLHKLTPT